MSQSLSMPRVLVIDDEPLETEVIVFYLKQLGVTEVQVADNGRKALRTLKFTPFEPDLILVDIYMPEMDGIEFMFELKQLVFTGKIILLSGVNIEMLALARQIARDLDLHVVGAVEKPFAMETLAELLQAARSGDATG